MTTPVLRRSTMPLIVIATISALFMRSMLRAELTRRGMGSQVAADLSYLVIPVALLLLTFPVWREVRHDIAGLYRRSKISMRVVVVAIAVGILMRTAWWGMTFARVSFGWFTEPNTGVTIGPEFHWQCDPPMVLALGIAVMAIVVPAVEEIVHRGYVFRYAKRWGLFGALLISSLSFMMVHSLGSWITAFLAGIVFALQFHRTGSLWSSTISHATFNLLVQFDWRCLEGRWSPAPQQLPVLDVGLTALAVVAACGLMISRLLLRQTPGAKNRSGR